MRLGTKILIGYGLIFIILLLSIIIHGFTRYVFFEDSVEARAIAHEIDDIDTLAVSVIQLLMPANDYLISGNKDEINKYSDLYSETMRQFHRISEERQAYKETLGILKRNIEEINRISGQIFALSIPLSQGTMGSNLMYKMDKVGDYTYEVIKAQDKVYHERLEELNKKSRKNIRLVNLITLTSWVFLLGSGFVVTYLFNEQIKKPIEKLSTGFQGVSHGRWSHVKLDQNDELGDLANEFNSMVERLGSTYEDLEKEVRNRTHELNELNAKLETMAITDGLTNVFNYRYFHGRLQDEFNRTVRYERPLALLMIDIDLFKNFNDTYGHQAGDNAIQAVASILSGESRQSDVVARYGGEEFVIISPEMDSKSALLFAEKLRLKVEKSHFVLRENRPLVPLTISVGIAVYPEIKSNCEELLKKADEALYVAKSNGRNQVILYDPDMKPGQLNPEHSPV